MPVKIKLHQKFPTNWIEREGLRNKGQFWTPAWVADAMVSYVAQNTKLVFDPATGRGAFFEALLRHNKKGLSFYGLDVDDVVLGDPIYQQNKCRVEKRDFIKDPPKRKFRAIVGNPPYIRHHRVDSTTKAILKSLSLTITGNTIDGRAGYHIYFLIQALNLLERNGRLAFIMPADTCEGKFADKLWKWICVNFCIEGVINFDKEATPFPNVDTNAIVFLIKKASPAKIFHWVQAKEAYTDDLLQFVGSGFKEGSYQSINVVRRDLNEAIATGLSRPPQTAATSKFHLNDFASVMRGIATGSNEFFFLTAAQVKDLAIPKKFFKKAIGRSRDVTESVLTATHMLALEEAGRPVNLLSLTRKDKLPASITSYLKTGEKMGLPTRALIRQRNPWYKMEQRKIPALLFTYLGIRTTRFIRNDAGVLPLTGFLCVYPVNDDKVFVDKLWQALNHPDTLENLRLVGKSYGSGAIKVEPGNLGRLTIPEHVVAMFRLDLLK